MAVNPAHIGKILFIGMFKVLSQANPDWEEIKDKPIKDMFKKIRNPTSWPSFFADAVGTSIQQEFILRGTYCPKLEATLKSYSNSGKTWTELEAYVLAALKPTKVKFV